MKKPTRKKDHHEIGPTEKITAAVRLKPWFRGLWSWHTACTGESERGFLFVPSTATGLVAILAQD